MCFNQSDARFSGHSFLPIFTRACITLCWRVGLETLRSGRQLTLCTESSRNANRPAWASWTVWWMRWKSTRVSSVNYDNVPYKSRMYRLLCSVHLEELVEQRTAEVKLAMSRVEELLHQMLPKPVAILLAQGQTVHPEYYDRCPNSASLTCDLN